MTTSQLPIGPHCEICFMVDPHTHCPRCLKRDCECAQPVAGSEGDAWEKVENAILKWINAVIDREKPQPLAKVYSVGDFVRNAFQAALSTATAKARAERDGEIRAMIEETHDESVQYARDILERNPTDEEIAGMSIARTYIKDTLLLPSPEAAGDNPKKS